MKYGLLTFLFLLWGCQRDAPEPDWRAWPKTPREAFAGMEDTSCACLVDIAKCRKLEVERSWAWEAQTFRCVPVANAAKAQCSYIGRNVSVDGNTSSGPWSAGTAIVSHVKGRGWCFHADDTEANVRTSNSADWPLTTEWGR